MLIENRVKKVNEWFERNVKTYRTPAEMILFNFSIDAQNYAGRFSIKLDGVEIQEKFRFGLGGNGEPEIFFPVFHSPMGAPASYPAVELTGETRNAISEVLANILPRVKPFGLNKATGEWILATTHKLKDRVVDLASYEQQFTAISKPDYEVIKKIIE
jgi:hypothetical protein